MTAGHNAMPAICDRMPAAPRTTTAPKLYNNIAATNPLAARLCASPRASPTGDTKSKQRDAGYAPQRDGTRQRCLLPSSS